MADINSLSSRIDAEFKAVEEKVKKFQTEQVEAHQQRQQRQQRLERLGQVFEEMREILRPRLEMLVAKFASQVKVTPRITPSVREGIFEFESRLARVRLKFGASTDRDVRKLVLSYDLEIIPVLIRFQPYAEIEFPLDAVDKEAAAKWMDDRIVDFVKIYFSLGETDVYLKDQMVEDPIAKVRFPKLAAGATLERAGQKYYFIGEETRREFEKQLEGKAK